MKKEEMLQIFERVGKEDPSKTYQNIGAIAAILVLALEDTKGINRDSSILSIINQINISVKELEKT